MKGSELIYLIRLMEIKMEEIENIKERVIQTKPLDVFTGAFLALNLHHLYCAIEDLFKEICKVCENRIDDPSRYHSEILKRMTYDLLPLRPAVISKESFELLNELRKFRHFLRNAYSVDLDLKKLERLRRLVEEEYVYLERDFGEFKKFLESVLEKITKEVL